MTEETSNPTAVKRYGSTADLPTTLRLFPLPGVLVFPRETLPLNVFEPRYLQLVDDVLAGNRLMGLIQPHESDLKKEVPGLQSIGCAARLTGFQETGDGRYLISLTGVCRFEIVRELEEDRLYRSVEVSWERFSDDLSPSEEAGEINRKRLLELVREYLERNNMEANWEVIHQTPDENLINYFCMASPFGIKERQALLEAGTLSERTDMMIALAEVLLARDDDDGLPVH